MTAAPGNERRLLQVWVQGIGVLGPGLDGWPAARSVLRGSEPHATRPTALPPPSRLPAAERRRAGAAVKLALAVADEAVLQAGLDPSRLATVFTSSSGEGSNCHVLCDTLASPAPMVSPTRFTNSVHNAPAGCWHIAVGSRASSSSLCAFDDSFAAGLLEAATSVRASGAPILLVASDSPYPEPLNAKRPLPDHFGAALVLAAEADARSLAVLTLTLAGAGPAGACDQPSLDALRRAIPAARSLPLLAALAQERPQRVVLPGTPGLTIDVEPLGPRNA